MRNKILNPIILPLVLYFAFSGAAFAENPLDRAGQIEKATGIDIGTYQELAEQEATKKAAEEAALKQKEAGEKFDIGLEIGKFILGAQDLTAKWFSVAKNWISSKIKRVPEKAPPSEEAERPAIIKPIILMFSGIKNTLFNLKKEGYVPFTEERKSRIERAKKISEPPISGFDFPELPISTPSKESPDSLADLLLTPVPIKCRANIFDSCDSCPRVTDPYKYFELSVVSESCSKCIIGNYDRLQLCIINLKFPIKKPSDGTEGVIIE